MGTARPQSGGRGGMTSGYRRKKEEYLHKLEHKKEKGSNTANRIWTFLPIKGTQSLKKRGKKGKLNKWRQHRGVYVEARLTFQATKDRPSARIAPARGKANTSQGEERGVFNKRKKKTKKENGGTYQSFFGKGGQQKRRKFDARPRIKRLKKLEGGGNKHKGRS